MLHLSITLLIAATAAIAQPQTQAPGAALFEGSTDIGVTPKAGSSGPAQGARALKVTGGGANIWGTEDAFHFAYRRVSGDITIESEIEFEGAGVDPHRKAVLMIRQDLTAGAAYADAALHGDGLTSLQYRESAGGATKEVKAAARAPRRLRLERRGREFRLLVGEPGAALVEAGRVEMAMADPVYVGIGVSAHNADVLETAVFSNISVQAQPRRPRYRSSIVVFDMQKRAMQTIHKADQLIEAPNWSKDGKHLLVNSNGSLWRIAPDGAGGLQRVELDAKYRCNNDHDYSPDGRLIAISASTPESPRSQVYVINPDGTNPRLLTALAPSYFHGWSPDGKWLAYVGQRNNRYHLFRVSVEGGEEQRLTSQGDYDDGPDYSPDGKWIYFNSERSGGWDIWRVPAAGGGEGDAKAERVTSDEWQDWFPHPSPDGKRMVFLSFPPGTKGHDGRMMIRLRMIQMPGRRAASPKIETVAEIFGGQGTINVNSWSPDSKRFAFVVYELMD